MKYKLLCLDVDGTLLDSKKELPEENVKAIKKAYDSGVKISIASGRSPWSVKELLDQIGIDACGICLNGSYIIDGNNMVFEHAMNEEEIKKVAEIVVKYNVKAFFSTSEINITNRADLPNKDSNVEKSVARAQNYILCDNDELVQILSYYKNCVYKVSINEENKEKYNKVREELENFNTFEVQKSDINYLDVNSKNITKASGVKALSDYFNINLSDTICIGDNENDIDMIKNCGLGIAMANSCKELFEVCDDTTSSNDEFGVAEAIYKHLIEK